MRFCRNEELDYWLSILSMSHLTIEVKVRLIRGSIQMSIWTSNFGGLL